MKDIVERLREDVSESLELCEEAANEIEQLRRLIEAMKENR